MGAWSALFFLLRRQRGGIVDGQIPPAFLHIEPQRHLVIVLSRDGQTAEVCIIRVPVRQGYAFTVDDFVGWRALVQGEPQPQRQDLPVGIEGRDNVYSFGHTDHLIYIIQTYVRKINRENSDLENKIYCATIEQEWSTTGSEQSAEFDISAYGNIVAVIPSVLYDGHFGSRNLKLDYRGISNGKAYIAFQGVNDSQTFTLQIAIFYKG